MKKVLSLTLALLMCLLITVTVSAVEENYRLRWDMGATSNNPVYVEWHVATQTMQVTYVYSGNFFQLRDAANPDAEQKSKLYIKDGGGWKELAGITSKIVGVDDERDGTWFSEMFSEQENYSGSPTYHTVYLQFFKDGAVFAFDGGVDYGVYFEIYTDGYPHGSMPDDIFTFGNPLTSEWALSEIGKAETLGLVPESLRGADLSKPITRKEFAAVSVKAYEALSGRAAIPAVVNPFTDTDDIEVLEAYNEGIAVGVAADKFDPDALLNREQAAAMLTRVFKRATIPTWSIENDITLDYIKPAPFADDSDISDWARDSVYFMAANGIIAGTGDNMFSPKAVTPEQQAQGYAQATREQALIIAVRMVENLKK